MKIQPELEAYRDRLMARAAAWGESSETDLQRDLGQCHEQVALLERAVAELRRRLEGASPAEAEVMAHRLGVQDQMCEMTAAYAEVLRRHIEGRSS